MCAVFHLKPIEGITIVLSRSNITAGSPTYRILSGDVLVSSVILLAKSLDILSKSAPRLLNKTPSAKPISESADAPVATPPATPAVIISSLTISF